MLRTKVPIKPPSNPPRPEDRMRGVCQTCKQVVFSLRKDAKLSPGERWIKDLPCAACLNCGAVVYLLPEKDDCIYDYQI